MYYKDFTTYEYLYQGFNILDCKVLNIGWLDFSGHNEKFTKGSLSDAIENKILSFCTIGHANLTRGFHLCDYPNCDQSFVSVKLDRNKRSLGSAEIWVKSEDSTIYVAPDLIYHYIKCHNYLPPKEFIDAVAFSTDVFIKEGDWKLEEPFPEFIQKKVMACD